MKESIQRTESQGEGRQILAALVSGREFEDLTASPTLLCEIFSREDLSPMAGTNYKVKLSSVDGLHSDEVIAESPWHFHPYYTRCFWSSYVGEDCPLSNAEILVASGEWSPEMLSEGEEDWS